MSDALSHHEQSTDSVPSIEEVTVVDTYEKGQLSLADLISGTLLSPKSLFDYLADSPITLQQPYLWFSLLIVLLVSAGIPIHMAIGAGELPWTTTLYSVTFAPVGGVIAWFSTAALFASLGFVFQSKTRLIALLTLTGFATLPWIFLGPARLLSEALPEPAGLILGLPLYGLIWLWSVVLFLLAIGVVFKLSLDRLLIFLALPMGMMLLCFNWLLGFFDTLARFS